MSDIVVFLQDNDPRIIYSGSWSQVGPLRDGSQGEHGDSAHTTSQVGASASLRFRGNAVIVFLTITSIPEAFSENLEVAFALDGLQYSYTSPAISQPLFGQQAFNLPSGLDPNADHTITVTQRGTGVPLRLDSISYTIPGGGQAGPAAQPHSPDGRLIALSGPLPDPPSPTTASRPPPATSSQQPNTNPSPNPPQTPLSSSNHITESFGSPSSTRDSGTLTRLEDATPVSGRTSANTRPTAPPSASRTITTTDSRGAVITKILPPDRVITSTDSTGGIVIRTEPASDDSSGGGGSKGEVLGTGTIIAIVLGIVVALAILGLVLLLLLKRRRRKQDKKGYGSSSSDITPFYETTLSRNLRERKASRGGGGDNSGDAEAGSDVIDIRRRSQPLSVTRTAPPAYSPGDEALVSISEQ